MKQKMIVVAVLLAMNATAQAVETAALDEVVVTAPQSTQPLTVKTNPKKPRQPVPAHDGADYLKTIPGFSVIRKGGTDGDPVLRGMAGSRLNILLDGEHILGGCGGRMDPPTAYVFPSSYDSITVLKGPQTVIHGAGNSAGTVLFERSVKPEAAGLSGSASLMVGSFGRNDETVDAKVASESAYLRAGVTRSQADDYKDGNGAAVHSAYNRWSANAAMGWTPDDDTRLELTAAKSDGKAAYADRSMDGVKFARDNIGLKFDKQRMDGLLDSIEAQVYYNYIDHVMDNYSLRTQTAMTKMVSNPDRETMGLRSVLGLAMGDTTRAKVGVDYQSNRHTLRSSMNQATTPYELMARTEDANFRNYGVFGEATYDVNDSARVIGGLRVDSWHAEDKRAASLTARDANNNLYTVANPTSGQSRDKLLSSGFVRLERDLASTPATVYAGIGHTERFPDYWELISANKESLTTTSAFNTSPEKTTQLDAGLHYSEGAVSGSVSAFYSKVKDFILIQSRVVKAVPTTRTITVTRNVDATTYGAEAGVAYQLAEYIKVDGSLAYVHGNNDTDGTALGQMSPLEVRIGLNYDNKVWSFGGLVRGVAAQDRVAVNQGNIAGQDIAASKGFGVLSLNAGWRINKAAQLTAGVDNLLNKSYAEHISRAGTMVSGFTQTTRVNEVGRNLWVKLNADF